MADMSVSRLLVNNYIEQKKSSIDNRYRPLFHMSPSVGWLNDPNGLCYFRGQYHLYYQAYPYRTKPGQMMWGHFVSDDLVCFDDKGIALSLDELGENAYSGGAILEGDALHIVYTLHTEKHPQNIRYDGEVFEPDPEENFSEEINEEKKHWVRESEGKDIKEEEIYHSFSLDGDEFERGIKVFDNDTLPSNISPTDFRDPCPIKIGDAYYLFLGGKDMEKNAGLIIVLKGKTLDHFDYAFSIGPCDEFGEMAECPSYIRLGDKDVLLVCGCYAKRRGNSFRNLHCTLFLVGNIDFEKGRMDINFIQEMDKGDCFYAPQFVRGINRPVLIGWLEMWGKRYPTSVFHHGYVGAFSIPREISLSDNRVLQWPIRELDSYLRDVDGPFLPRQADVRLTMGLGASLLIRGDNGSLLIHNGIEGLSLDNSQGNGMFECLRHTDEAYPECSLRMLLDTSSLEVFVEGGKEVISTRFYIDGELTLSPSGDIRELQVKEIGTKR